MEGASSSSDSDSDGSGEVEKVAQDNGSNSSFASMFEDGLEIDSGEGEELLDQFDDGFAEVGVGDDAVPTYDLAELQELETPESKGFAKIAVSVEAERQRGASNSLRVGAQKRANPLDELRQVFGVSGGLKVRMGMLTRDFTERYLFKISADGYHVGWVAEAGSDFDFYNTKHEIVHSEEKKEMPQLSNPKLLGSGDPSSDVLDQVRKAYKLKTDPIYVSDVSKGYMYRVLLGNKQIGWTNKNGRDVEFYDVKGKVLLKLAQRQYPKLSVGPRDVLKEVRRVYNVEKNGLRLKNVGSSRAKFRYKVVEATEKEKHLGWANISSGYYLFFEKEGKKRLFAVSRFEMPKKDRWRGHSKSFGISNEIKATASAAGYSEKGNKPQGIFGLIDPTEIPGNVEDGEKEPGLDDKKKKKKKKKKKSGKKKGVTTVMRTTLF